MRVLVVGGGIGGLSSTIALRSAGVEVDVVEINPKWDVYGVGINQPGNAIRALDQLGLGERAIAEGFAIQGSRFRDGEGNVLGAVPAPPLLGDRFPGMNGITRPRLHRIFQDAVRESGAEVRLGVTVDALEQDDDGVERHAHGRQQRPLRPRDRCRRDQLAGPRARLRRRAGARVHGPGRLAPQLPEAPGAGHARHVRGRARQGGPRPARARPDVHVRHRALARRRPRRPGGAARRDPPGAPRGVRRHHRGAPRHAGSRSESEIVYRPVTRCSCRRPGTAGASCSSGTRRTRPRPTSARAPRWRSRTPWCSPRRSCRRTTCPTRSSAS